MQSVSQSITTLLPLLDFALGERGVVLSHLDSGPTTIDVRVSDAFADAGPRSLRVDLSIVHGRGNQFRACAEGNQTVCDDALESVADVIARTVKGWS